jgi:membrane-associated protease RseP (regulator of RpoE activity)
VNIFEFLVVPLTFAFSIVWFHEIGHTIAARKLGYGIIAWSFFTIFPSGVFREETNNKKHQKIIAAGGPLGGLFAFVLFGATLNLISPLSSFILIVGLAMALLCSLVDFIELLPLSTRPGLAKTKMKLLWGSWLLVFSKKRWQEMKTKIEQEIGKKINFKEITLG